MDGMPIAELYAVITEDVSQLITLILKNGSAVFRFADGHTTTTDRFPNESEKLFIRLTTDKNSVFMRTGFNPKIYRVPESMTNQFDLLEWFQQMPGLSIGLMETGAEA